MFIYYFSICLEGLSKIMRDLVRKVGLSITSWIWTRSANLYTTMFSLRYTDWSWIYIRTCYKQDIQTPQPTVYLILTLVSWLLCAERAWSWEDTVTTTPLTRRNSPGLLPCWITPSTLTASWEPLCTLIDSPKTRGCGEIANCKNDHYRNTMRVTLLFLFGLD